MHRRTIVTPWVVGILMILMILLGLVALALAWIQHRQAIKALKAEVGAMPYSIAGLVAAMGISALVIVAFRLECFCGFPG